MGYVIKRPINGISINGDEYVCDENGNTMVFDNKSEAKEFLKENGYDDDGMENEGSYALALLIRTQSRRQE